MTHRLLDDHRTVVIGAGGTLGRAICAAYAEQGASVVALDCDAAAATAAIRELPGSHHDAAAIDVRLEESVARAAEIAWDRGSVDSVVYAAGVAATGDVATLDPVAWRAVLTVNLDGAYLCARAFTARLLAEGRPASLAFLASTAGLRGEAGAAAYCASKFGLIGLVRCLALEIADRGLRANAICPGNVEGPMLASVAAAQARRTSRDPADVLRGYAEQVPRGRLVDPLEVGRATVWLASPAASAINGVALPIDGGTLAA